MIIKSIGFTVFLNKGSKFKFQIQPYIALRETTYFPNPVHIPVCRFDMNEIFAVITVVRQV